jgi:hypothetical protein
MVVSSHFYSTRMMVFFVPWFVGGWELFLLTRFFSVGCYPIWLWFYIFSPVLRVLPMVCGGRRGFSPRSSHGRVWGVSSLPGYAVLFSLGWVSSVYLSPIPPALRVLPRVVVYMGPWSVGGEGILPRLSIWDGQGVLPLPGGAMVMVWVRSCYLTPIPPALRVLPRVEVWMPHGLWGEKGVLPRFSTWAGWEVSPYPDIWCWLLSGMGVIWLLLFHPRCVCFPGWRCVWPMECGGEKGFSPAFLYGMGRVCYPYPGALLGLFVFPGWWCICSM